MNQCCVDRGEAMALMSKCLFENNTDPLVDLASELAALEAEIALLNGLLEGDL